MHDPAPGSHSNRQRGILVTGSHRSGTTWVGRMLAASDEVGYIYQPFHPTHRPGICGVSFPYSYTYIHAENEGPYLQALGRTLQFSYDFLGELRALKQGKDVVRMVRDGSSFWYHRMNHSRPLIKESLAFFSAEWLAARFDMAVVVMVRHPAAFAGSLKRVGWTYDFSELLAQPRLIQDHLAPFEAEIRDYAHTPPDLLDQASLLWRMIYHTVRIYQERHPSWLFLRHEDLSLGPMEGFRDLYDALGLPFTAKAATLIERYCNTLNATEARAGVIQDLRRNSRANVWSWKHRLTPAEVDRVRANVEAVSVHFYDDGAW